MKKLSIFLFLTLIAVTIFSVNSKIDSLQGELEKHNQLVIKAGLARDIGYAYLELKEYDNSLEYFNIASELYLELDMIAELSSIYYSIGRVYGYKIDYINALEYYSKSLSID